MRRSGRVPWTEVRVGVVILFAFAVLLWAAFNGTGMTVFEKSKNLHAYFGDVAGLVTGSPVLLGGIEVGHVTGIEFKEMEGTGKILVSFKVKEDAWSLVSSESRASIASAGLMGDKYLSITVRESGDPPAEPDAYLTVETPSDLTSAFADAPDLMTSLTATTERLSRLLDRIDRGEGFVGGLMTESRTSRELDSLVSASRRLMNDLNKSQVHLVRSIERTAESFDSLTNGVLHGGGTLSKLVWDTTLYSELSGVANRANSFLTTMETGEGTLGRLSSDSTMYLEVRDLVADMRVMLDDIMKNPRRYFKFSVF